MSAKSFSLGLVVLLIWAILALTEALPKEEEDERSQHYHRMVSESGVATGQIDLDDLPLKGLSGQKALDLLFQRYRARMMHQQEPRMFSMEDLSDKEIGEICGNSASLECGKKVLKYSANILQTTGGGDDNGTDQSSPMSAPSNSMTIHRKCNLRKEFLDCIDVQRRICRRQAERGIYPRLPPKSIIRSTQSKIWRALWTSGGCVLIN